MAASGRPAAASPARGQWWWVPGAITVVTIASVIVRHALAAAPEPALSRTRRPPAATRAPTSRCRRTSRRCSRTATSPAGTPRWYDGFPLYTFYFTLPDALVAVGAGSSPTTSPSSWARSSARSCSRSAPGPAAGSSACARPSRRVLAAATLPFLFDYTFTIYGGNLFSTLAGEYSLSFSLSLAILFLGLFACAVREGRHRAGPPSYWPAASSRTSSRRMYALGGAVVLTVIELLPGPLGRSATRACGCGGSDPSTGERLARRTRDAVAGRLDRRHRPAALGLVAGALRPDSAYSTSMGYTNVRRSWALFFPEADTWALVLARAGVVARRRRPQPLRPDPHRARGGLGASALVLDPQGSLYNVRLLPLWFLSVYLMAGWAFGIGLHRGGAAGGASRPALGAGGHVWSRWELGGERRRCRTGRHASAGRRRRRGHRPRSAAPCWAVAVMLGRRPALRRPAVRSPVHVGAERGHELVVLQLRGLRGPARISRVPLGHPDHGGRWAGATGAAAPCGSTTPPRTASARPRRSCSCPTGRTAASTRWRACSSSPRPRTPYHFINQAELSAAPVRARGRAALRACRRDARGRSTCSCSA